MSDHESNSQSSNNSGYSTPVPELDDHRHQNASVQKSLSRRGTADTMHSNFRRNLAPDLTLVDQGLLPTIARDFEEAVEDGDLRGISPLGRTVRDRSRRGTVTTLDPRSVSPPSSVKAFAEARRREDCELQRTASHDSRKSRRSLRSRRYTNDNDAANSIAGTCRTAEEDVCFPLHPEGNKNTLHIDFELLEDFIADEENRDRTPPQGQPQARIFHDLTNKHAVPTIVTSDGDIMDMPSNISLASGGKSMTSEFNEKHEEPQRLENRFEFFSTMGESTIHAAEFGDLVLPGEDVRSLFTLPPSSDDSDGVWWLNMNSPTKEEITAICRAFGIHPLTIEDINTQEAREKIELFPSYYFACFRSFHVEEVDGGQEYEPFNTYVVVFRQGTLSFSFVPNPHAAQVRQRITKLKDFMSLSSDWICYALIDDIVDGFAPVINSIERETDVIEDEVFISRNDDMHTFLRRIGMTRKNVMGLMKLLGGKADVLRGFTKRCNADYRVTPKLDIGLYLGDIQDHVVTMMTSLAHFEKMLSRSHSNYLAQLSIENLLQGNDSNKVLSKITLLASILVPLNLVCGLFGMNVAVPWKNSDSLGPFFGILGFLVFFSILALILAKRLRYI
ncbi:hypothetical protein LZ554_006514 [Drepanopeziza brunnea f. sp. 'monogermtubi']|nr:hypothetical protein LZ554_006514 [Drepanopeziza brunnea f. sp. 'monogermtubi']